MNENRKIKAHHLSRTAYLYIRQSTIRQVQENTESTLRQYALREKLVSFGWDSQMIEVIDNDLGHSGKTTLNRDGFKQLVANVANGMAGAVACIEASRLSRSSSDWGRLIEYCAMTDTVLIDADGVYNPNDFNDRLLLGLKGTMSEAELHFLQERMRGGLMNKVKRGELKTVLPIGYVHDECGRIVKDPDVQVRETIEMFFSTFRIVKTGRGVALHFKEKGYKFPHKAEGNPYSREIRWLDLQTSQALSLLHNPIYAGVYAYGRNQTVWTGEGKKSRKAKMEDWHVFLRDHHEGYISYEEFRSNENILLENCQPWRSEEGKKTPPREGTALIQGIVFCGKCGHRMTVRYKQRGGEEGTSLIPIYRCSYGEVQASGPLCQSIYGDKIDRRISEIIKERLTPEAVRMSVEIRKEVGRRKEEQVRYFKLGVEKAKYEADLARKRFLSVDPDNRLVALELESAWNVRLAELQDAEKEYEEELARNAVVSNEELDQKVAGLTENFAEVWDNPSLKSEDKKRIIRHLIEDVTLTKQEETTLIQIRFRGGTTEQTAVSNPLPSYKAWETSSAALELLRRESGNYTMKELVELLNAGGEKSGRGRPFTEGIIHNLMKYYGLQNKKQKYLALGYITAEEKAKQIGMRTDGMLKKIRDGTLIIEETDRVLVSGRNEYLYKP